MNNIFSNQTSLGTAAKFGHYYDLTKTMDEQVLQASYLSYFNPLDELGNEERSVLFLFVKLN